MRAKSLNQAFEIFAESLEEYLELIDEDLQKEMATELANRLREDAHRYIDRPRPETIRAIKPALRGQFGVRIQGIAVVWLRRIIEGYTETDTYIPVLKNVKLDRYGNEPRGQFKRLLERDDTFELKKSRNGLPRGIYKRLGGNRLAKLYKYVTSQRRNPTFPYEKLALNRVDEVFLDAARASFDNISDSDLLEELSVIYDIEL